eukprot:Polyplicarium_translucidae@DN2799_c0_g1_i1.p5
MSSPKVCGLSAVLGQRVRGFEFDTVDPLNCGSRRTRRGMFGTRRGMFPVAVALALLLMATPVMGGPFAALATYGVCQTGCNVAWASCCAAAGVVVGTATAGVGVAPAVLACSAAQGVCMAGCAALTVGAAVTPVP